jgi:hypothetical protein
VGQLHMEHVSIILTGVPVMVISIYAPRFRLRLARKYRTFKAIQVWFCMTPVGAFKTTFWQPLHACEQQIVAIIATEGGELQLYLFIDVRLHVYKIIPLGVSSTKFTLATPQDHYHPELSTISFIFPKLSVPNPVTVRRKHDYECHSHNKRNMSQKRRRKHGPEGAEMIQVKKRVKKLSLLTRIPTNGSIPSLGTASWVVTGRDVL